MGSIVFPDLRVVALEWVEIRSTILLLLVLNDLLYWYILRFILAKV